MQGGLFLSDKIVWSAKVSPDVKHYLRERGISAGAAITDYFRNLKSQELTEKLKELNETKQKVVLLEQEVVLLQQQSTTNHVKSNTIFDEFQRQDRNINHPTQQDRFWIQSQLDHNDVKDWTVDKFIQHYQNDGGKHE